MKWESDFTFDSLGTTIRVRSQDGEFGESVRRLMKHFSATDASPDEIFSISLEDSRYAIFRGGAMLMAEASWDEALIELLVLMNEATIVGAGYLLVHAGVVARGGEVVAFPAEKRSGKSTLVAECLRRGFHYVSDEAMVIDTATDRVIAYPKPLWLTAESRQAIQLDDNSLSTRIGDDFKSPVLPEEVGAVVASGYLTLRHAVLLDRGGGSSRLDSVGQSQIAYMLLQHCFNRDTRPSEWFRTVGRLTRSCSGSRLTYDEAHEAVDCIERLVESDR